jgi:hypothetical protein
MKDEKNLKNDAWEISQHKTVGKQKKMGGRCPECCITGP